MFTNHWMRHTHTGGRQFVYISVSDLDVHLSTRRHLVRPDVTESYVRQAADVDSQRLQSQHSKQ